MAVSPADFELYSRATGVPYPRTAEERMRMAPEVHKYSRSFAREPSTLQKAAGVVGKAAQIGGALATIGGVTRALGPKAGAIAAEVLKGGDDKPPSGGSRITQGSGPDYDDGGGRGEDLALDIWGEGTVYPDDSPEPPATSPGKPSGGPKKGPGGVPYGGPYQEGDKLAPVDMGDGTQALAIAQSEDNYRKNPDIQTKVANFLGYPAHQRSGRDHDTGLNFQNPLRRINRGQWVTKQPDVDTGEQPTARYREDINLGLGGMTGMPLRPKMKRLAGTLNQIWSSPYLFTGQSGDSGHHGLLDGAGGALMNIAGDIVAPELAIPAQIIGGAGRVISGLHPMHLLEGGGRAVQSGLAIGGAMAQQAVGDTSDLLGLTVKPAVSGVRTLISDLPGVARTGAAHLGTTAGNAYRSGIGTRFVADRTYDAGKVAGAAYYGSPLQHNVDSFIDGLKTRFLGHPQTDEPNVDDRTNMSTNLRAHQGLPPQAGQSGMGALIDSQGAEGVAFVQPSMPDIESIKRRFYPVTEIPDQSGHVSGVSLDPARGTTTWNLQGKGGQTSPYTYHTPEPVMMALTDMADEGTLNQESMGGLHNTLIGKGGFNPAWGKDKDLGQMIEAMESEKARRAAAKDAGKRTRSFKSPYGSLMQRIPKEELSKYGYGEQSESDAPWS